MRIFIALRSVWWPDLVDLLYLSAEHLHHPAVCDGAAADGGKAAAPRANQEEPVVGREGVRRPERHVGGCNLEIIIAFFIDKIM